MVPIFEVGSGVHFCAEYGFHCLQFFLLSTTFMMLLHCTRHIAGSIVALPQAHPHPLIPTLARDDINIINLFTLYDIHLQENY
jgi:hypothetical protein